MRNDIERMNTPETGRYLTQIAIVISRVVIVCSFLAVLFIGYRVFIWDRFIVPSESMVPTLIPGDRILVNKLIFGARIYKNFDFSRGQSLESWRMPGLREIRPNDVLVFNVPQGYDRDKIEFKINYVYSKRCVGTPGDTVSIVRGFYKNNYYDGVIGLASKQQQLAASNDLLIPDRILRTIPKGGDWTIREFGPLYIPAKGDTIHLDSLRWNIYRTIIEYETNSELSDTFPAEYVFRENYYFVGGDNVMHSNDSRYWGFVPEEFIIGVAQRIAYSHSGRLEGLRWNRVWKRI